MTVSTHSRLKAAEIAESIAFNVLLSFNTQPPEGGWMIDGLINGIKSRFNTQPPEGGWLVMMEFWHFLTEFQHTAARRRLALVMWQTFTTRVVSTHSRPKEAGKPVGHFLKTEEVSTHSRLKAAGIHDAPDLLFYKFQHTAA